MEQAAALEKGFLKNCTGGPSPCVGATTLEGLQICLMSPSLGKGGGDVLPVFGKVDLWALLCWCLEAISSSRTTSAFPAALCMTMSLVTSCASLLRWPSLVPSHPTAVSLQGSLASSAVYRRAITGFVQELKC